MNVSYLLVVLGFAVACGANTVTEQRTTFFIDEEDAASPEPAEPSEEADASAPSEVESADPSNGADAPEPAETPPTASEVLTTLDEETSSGGAETVDTGASFIEPESFASGGASTFSFIETESSGSGGGAPTETGFGGFGAGGGTGVIEPDPLPEPPTLTLPALEQTADWFIYEARVGAAPSIYRRAASPLAIELGGETTSVLAAVMLNEDNAWTQVSVNPCNPELAGEPSVHQVPEEFATIQAAIDAAAYGDTVFVQPGTYFERLKLKSGLRLIGAGAQQTTLDGQGVGQNLIDFSGAGDVVVRGFTLRGVGQSQGCGDPDDVRACGGFWYASAVYGDGHVQDVEAGCGYSSIFFSQNIVADNEIGMLLDFLPRAVITNNIFVANKFGLALSYHHEDALIANNVFYGNSTEALSILHSDADLVGNIFAANAVGGYYESIAPGTFACNVTFGNGELGSAFTENPGAAQELDPEFVDAMSRDFRLAESSPAQSAGCFGESLDEVTAAGAYGGLLGDWYQRSITVQ